ncbi:hypothetical protein CAEBREN_20562 [Caenorhabditis brenneri]|uniref:Uncharacterized protein n=1 Tax=Caenorhabditis brenneri TaxID=135651 RepID=G0P8W5_CAEBE|nr:hypothetical protein CAEBREN_20562 [Caenorhabditis brenneri]
MLKNHVLIGFFVIIFFTKSFVFSAPVKMTIEFHRNDGECGKYIKRGMDFLEIKYARLLQYIGGKEDNVQQIAGNVVCRPVKFEGVKMDFKCDGQKGTEKMKYNLILAVTAKKQMLSGQINYRYNDTSMGLFKNKYLDVDKLDSEVFQPDQHISIKRIDIRGLKSVNLKMDFGDCQGEYPKRLIADHGIYMSSARSGIPYWWTRAYFDPVQMGEAMGWWDKLQD